MTWVTDILDAAIKEMNSNAGHILERYNRNTSFERWTTDRLAQSISSKSGIKALLEVGYTKPSSAFPLSDPSNEAADLLLINWEARQVAVFEAAIVLPGTQAKWKKKIARDYEKLKSITAHDVQKYMMVYSFSSVEKVIGESGWDYWFEDILLTSSGRLPTPDRIWKFPFGDEGEWAVQLWAVS